jgi:hypothetical protein
VSAAERAVDDDGLGIFGDEIVVGFAVQTAEYAVQTAEYESAKDQSVVAYSAHCAVQTSDPSRECICFSCRTCEF